MENAALGAKCYSGWLLKIDDEDARMSFVDVIGLIETYETHDSNGAGKQKTYNE